MPDTALMYLRYSPRPEKKADNCPSLETQAARIKAYCEFAGLEPGESFADPLVSARKTSLVDRKGGKALIRELGYRIQYCPVPGWPSRIVSPRRTTIRHIVVYDLSRVFRNAVDALIWLDRWSEDGINLHTASGGAIIDTSNADGYLISGILAVVDGYSPRKTAERTSHSKQVRLASGNAIGPYCPFGWERDPESEPHPESGLPQGLRPNPDEQEAIRFAQELRAQGETYDAIARALLKAGHRPRGKEWYPGGIARLLKARLAE